MNMIANLSQEYKFQWRQKSRLGGTLTLTKVKLDWELLEAATSCWDPEARVFRFGMYEMCPTLEEFSGLLSVSSKLEAVVPKPKNGYATTIADYLGIPKKRIPRDSDNLFRFCPIKFLVQTEEETKFKALTVAVVSQLLLFRDPEQVDGLVFEVLKSLKDGKSLIPIVLAETISSLTRCAAHRNGRLCGSPALLQIWLREHIPFLSRNDRKGLNTSLEVKSPLLAHVLKHPRPATILAKEYFRVLSKLSLEQIKWTLPCGRNRSPRLAIQNRRYMILCGLYEPTPYVPIRVLRQFGLRQIFPGLVFEFETFDSYTWQASSTLHAHFTTLWQKSGSTSIELIPTEDPEVDEGYEDWFWRIVYPKPISKPQEIKSKRTSEFNNEPAPKRVRNIEPLKVQLQKEKILKEQAEFQATQLADQVQNLKRSLKKSEQEKADQSSTFQNCIDLLCNQIKSYGYIPCILSNQ